MSKKINERGNANEKIRNRLINLIKVIDSEREYFNSSTKK